MRKIFAILTALLLVSCSMNHDEVVVAMKATQLTKISKEQALKNLYSELKFIDEGTRAEGTQREVKSIKPLVGAVTRSGNALDNDLLYIVEFGEGQGSAVVAADTRLEPVIAVLDSDVLTAEDFANEDMEDISAYMASMIEDYTISVASSEGPIPMIPAPDDDQEIIYHYNIQPLLKTKWHQDTPYNNKCVEVYGSGYVAGCWPIALAQFMYYMNPTAGVIVNNTYFLMSSFSSLEHRVFPTPQATNLIASFIYCIGQDTDADYSPGATGVQRNNAVNFLKNTPGISYPNAALASYNSSSIFPKLNLGKVVLTCGTTILGEGHAWVIDGGHYYTIRGTRYNSDGTADYVSESHKCVHCNFGWGGICDGYYTDGIFNTAIPNYEIDFANGDETYEYGESNFDRNLQIINY